MNRQTMREIAYTLIGWTVLALAACGAPRPEEETP